MPSDRATDIAVAGPYVTLVAVLVCLVVLFALRALFLPSGAFLWGSIALLALFSLSVLYQGLFMIRYPTTAVDERMRPPLGRPWSGSAFVRELFTPDSNVGAILVGLVGVLTAGFGLVITAVLASAAA